MRNILPCETCISLAICLSNTKFIIKNKLSDTVVMTPERVDECKILNVRTSHTRWFQVKMLFLMMRGYMNVNPL